MEAIIDGLPYVLAGNKDFEWSYAQQLSEAFRLTAIPTPADNSLVSRLPLTWEKGIGQATQHRATGRHVGGLRHSTCETRWEVMTPAKLVQTTTDNSTGSVAKFLRCFCVFGGELWGAFEQNNTASTVGRIAVLKYNASTDQWDDGNADIHADGSPQTGDIQKVYALAKHKNALFVGYGVHDNSAATTRYYIKSSSDGTTWTNRASVAAPWNINIATLAEDNDFDNWRKMDLLDFETDLVVALHNSTSSQIDVYYSSNATAGSPTWTAIGSISTSIARCKLAIWQDPYASPINAIPVVVTAEGVYKVDITNTAISQLIALPGASADGLGVGYWLATGALYVGLHNGDVMEYNVRSGGGIASRNLGPATKANGLTGDGLISARQGHANSIYGDNSGWLFMSYGGHAAGKNGSIFAYELERQAWHFIGETGTANEDIGDMIISTESDGTERLHFADETSGGFAMIEEINTPPTSGATIRYAASGTVDFAEDDMGDGKVAAGVFQAIAQADDLSASEAGEYIEFYSDDQDGDWGDTDRGSFLSGDKDLLYASGVGISANSMKHRVVLHRDAGDTTQAPKLKSLEVQAVVSQALLRSPLLPIDLTKTAAKYDRPVETMITTLETIFTSAVQVTVKIGKTSQFSAIVRQPPSFTMRVKQSDDQMDEGVLEGTAYVRFTQLLEGV